MRHSRHTLASAILLMAGAAMPLAALATGPAFAKETVQAEVEERIYIDSLSGAFLAARIAETDNDLDGAIEYYRKALSFDPDNLTLQQSLMLALIAAGHFDEALPLAENLKDVAEVERYSRLALGVEAIKTKQFRTAEAWLDLVTASDLDHLITKLVAAWARFGSGKPEEAVEVVSELSGPEWYTIFTTYHTALMADAAGFEDAEDRYKRVIDDRVAGGAAMDTYLRAVESYASFLARKGRKEEALAILDIGEEVAPGRVSFATMRTRIDGGRAVKATVSSPAEGAAEVLYDVAIALDRTGGESFVRLYLQYARALKPDGDVILFKLGSIAERMEQSAEAISYYELIPVSSPLSRLANLQLALNLADLERHDQAIVHLKAAVEQDVDDMRAYLSLGSVYSSQKDFASAAVLYDKAVARLPNPSREDWNIFYQRGIAYERLKEWEKAEPSFKKALELYPDQPQVLNYLGYSWVDMGINLEEGLEMIKTAVRLRPRDGYIVDSLGWAYYRLGRFEEAVTELERAIRLKPEDPVINDHLGDAYWRSGRRLEATFQWSHARDLKPEPEMLVDIETKLKEGLPPLENDIPVAEPAGDADKKG